MSSDRPNDSAAERATPAADRIASNVRRGISWNVVGAIATNVMRLVVVVTLGRLLDSRDFGVVAAALSVVTIFHMVRDIGLGPALVQRRELTDGHIRTAFATSLYLGLALAAVLALGAPLAGRLFHSAECVPVLRALAAIFAVRGAAATSYALCQRTMDFHAIALIDTTAYALGSLASIALAFAGLGPWALALGYLIEELVGAIAYLLRRRAPASLRIDRAKLRDLLGFGAGQTVFQIVNVLATQGDNLVVGNALGTAELGYYTRAYDLLRLPAAVFTNLVGNVLLPAFSRLQDDPVRLGAGFRRVIFVNALLILPASAVLIAVAPEMIRLLMGPHWDRAVLPFQILAITMMMRISYKVGVTVATAAGAMVALVTTNVVYATAVIGGALLGVRGGIVGVAGTTAGAIAIMYLMCVWLALEFSSASWREIVRAHVAGFVLAAIAAAGAYPLAAILRSTGAPAAGIVAAAAAWGAIVLATGVAIGSRRGGQDFAWLREELGVIARKLGRRPARSAST